MNLIILDLFASNSNFILFKYEFIIITNYYTPLLVFTAVLVKSTEGILPFYTEGINKYSLNF